MVLTLLTLGFSLEMGVVNGQTFPDRPIEIVIPGDAGSFLDVAARAFGDELGRVLKTPVISLNKPGASGTVGANFVVRSKKGGYAILYTNSGPIVYAKASNPEAVPYDPLKDLEPLGMHLFHTTAIVVQQGSPWKSFGDLVDYSKKNPGKISVGVHGAGSYSHFVLEIIKSPTGMEFTIVPFEGAAAVVTNLLGGHVQVGGFLSTNLVGPHVKAGKLRLLAVTRKTPEFPDVPTFGELGYKQVTIPLAWFAFFAPAGIPEEARKVLVPAIEKTIKNPELKAKMETLGATVEYASPAEVKKFLENEYSTARSIASRPGINK
jgi:tripartite-type tricarboxylate transporter receptor subunit TctC